MPEQDTVQDEPTEPTEPSLEPLRARMETACDLLTASHQQLTALCNEFEALLDIPDRNLGQIRRAQTAVRAAGMQTMGLTTDYLSSLNAYMKSLDTP